MPDMRPSDRHGPLPSCTPPPPPPPGAAPPAAAPPPAPPAGAAPAAPGFAPPAAGAAAAAPVAAAASVAPTSGTVLSTDTADSPPDTVFELSPAPVDTTSDGRSLALPGRITSTSVKIATIAIVGPYRS